MPRNKLYIPNININVNILTIVSKHATVDDWETRLR